MLKRTTALIVSATLALCLASTAFAASGVWVRVIIVKTDNVSAYVHELEAGRTMMKRLGLDVPLRVFRATFAGPNTGSITVTQEYPSLAALSDAQTKTAADPEFSAWLKKLDSIRTVLSDSLYREL